MRAKTCAGSARCVDKVDHVEYTCSARRSDARFARSFQRCREKRLLFVIAPDGTALGFLETRKCADSAAAGALGPAPR